MPIRNVMPDAKSELALKIRATWLRDLETKFAKRRAESARLHAERKHNPLMKSARDLIDEERLNWLKDYTLNNPRGPVSIAREIKEIETRLERHRQWRQLKAARLQVQQLKRFLKGHPEALQSLPKELGPAASSPR